MSNKDIGISIAVVIAILVVSAFFFINPLSLFMDTSSSGANSSANADSAFDASGYPAAQDPNQLLIQDTTVGTGAEAVSGATVSVNYIGKLQDGTTFDQSSDHGGAFSFTLGAGQVIPGWDQGVAGMKVGGTRVLVIPPSLGYGSQAVGPIPPNSTLIFQVQLVDVQNP